MCAHKRTPITWPRGMCAHAPGVDGGEGRGKEVSVPLSLCPSVPTSIFLCPSVPLSHAPGVDGGEDGEEADDGPVVARPLRRKQLPARHAPSTICISSPVIQICGTPGKLSRLFPPARHAPSIITPPLLLLAHSVQGNCPSPSRGGWMQAPAEEGLRPSHPKSPPSQAVGGGRG